MAAERLNERLTYWRTECSTERLIHVGLDVFEYLPTGAREAPKRYADIQFSEDAQDRFAY